jgi:predicted CXXCH cytochrome family protein
MNCHASGYNPDTNTYAFEGIVCSSCHKLTTEAEHPPAPVDIGDASTVCGQCHSGAHAPTYDEWLVSDHKKAGVDCVDCHTPHNNGLLRGEVNATCADCHQETLVDEVHMNQEMTCVDCHMNRRTTENGIHVVSTGHTMSIDPAVCSECHGNIHELSVKESHRPAEETSQIENLETKVTDLAKQAEDNRNSGIIGGALGMLILVIALALVMRLRTLL